MAIDNYGDLKQAIALWLNRNDMDTPVIGATGDSTKSTIIETLIELAERKIFRWFRGPANEELVPVPLIVTTNLIPVPADMLDLKALTVNGVALTFIEPFQFRRTIHNDLANQPCSFTREKGYFVLSASIEVTATTENNVTTYDHVPITIHYYADYSGMNEPTDTNQVLVTNTDLYLFGALQEAEGYLVNDKRIPIWQQKYEEAKAAAIDYNHQIDYNAGPLIMGGGTQ